MPVLTPEKKSAPTKCAARGQRALAAGFFALLLGPGLLWLALHSRCDTTNYENRTLTPFPGKSVPISDWPSAFESWLGDNAPFRNSFLSLTYSYQKLWFLFGLKCILCRLQLIFRIFYFSL